MSMQHFVSISGGKDSTAVACLALERAQKRSMDLRYLFADTGNEHPLTLEHIDYLGRALGIQIETVRADFSDRFAARREAMRRDWVKPLRRKQHSELCLKAAKADLGYAARVVLREECDCPIKVTPALPIHLVERAIALMYPTGNPFLDMAMLHGRFPGAKSRFCTDELKLEPMEQVKDRVRMGEGRAIVEWIGERAQESKAREAKPVLEIERCSFRAPAILYRPIHKLDALAVFAIAKRHGLKPNPLYLMGMSRVGCMPCIMCQKGELREIGLRFPEQVDRIEEWEFIVGGVARHAYTRLLADEAALMISSFMPMDKLPASWGGHTRSAIRAAVEWSKTSRGGRQSNLLGVLDALDFHEQPDRCSSRYGLCE